MRVASNGGTEFLTDPDVTIWNGDALSVLRGLPDESVDCCVTSPPYWGLRDYGHKRQLGLESTPAGYISALVEVFAEVRRVLSKQGTLWLNLGDAYAGSWGAQSRPNGTDVGSTLQGGSTLSARQIQAHPKGTHTGSLKNTPGLKPKDLMMLPARVAIALQDDGWWLRSEIVWAKLNPMPESVTDRPTAATERVFLLAKSQRYYYDGASVKEGAAWERWGKQNPGEWAKAVPSKAGIVQPRTKAEIHLRWQGEGRNMRNCWPLATESYEGAHFATYPQELVRRCILPGCPEGGTVLDPFGGSGTTALVARKHGRKAILIELNPSYCDLAAARLAQQSLLAEAL